MWKPEGHNLIKKTHMALVVCALFVFTGAWPAVVFADGPANVYKITIIQMELFNGTAWVTVFSGTSATIDIASVSSGEFAGTFLSGIDVPNGTYTQVRTTVSRTFTIKAMTVLRPAIQLLPQMPMDVFPRLLPLTKRNVLSPSLRPLR